MSTPIPSLGNKTPEQLKVAELREELKKRGINIKGLKKDLVERLDEILRQEAEEAEEEDDQSKKSSPEQVSDEEETPAAPVNVEVPQRAKEDAAVKIDEFISEVVEHDPNELLPGDDLKPRTVEALPSFLVPEENDVSNKGKEVEVERSQQIVTESEVASTNEAMITEPLDSQTATFGSKADSTSLNEQSGVEPAYALAVEVRNEGNACHGETQIGSELDEGLDAGKLSKEGAKILSHGVVEAKPQLEDKLSGEEVQDQAEKLKPFHRCGPVSSTDAVIIEASEAEEIPAENAALSEGLRSTAYGERDAEEEESVVEETGGEPVETMTSETLTVETVSVVTETTVVTTETLELTEIDADLSTAGGNHERSFTQKSYDAGTSTLEGKMDEEATHEHRRDKDEGVEVEQDAKAKDLKPMEIDSDIVSGVKRKDGEELRHQEPTKRQRRWNSDKSGGVSTDFSTPSAPEARESTQVPVALSPSTAALLTPKASAAANFDKSAPFRPALSRTEIAINGEVDKKRVVPPPTRHPSVSLKIDRFVRPFTIKAVRELLEQTGTVKEMWMDQIKTHCYVTYSSVEEATATRNALYHLQWPVAGGKLLVAEFVEPEEVQSRVEGINDKPASTPVTTPRASGNSSTPLTGPIGGTPLATHSLTSALPPPPPLPPPPRERPGVLAKKEQEPPIPTLDDLFKKTRNKPQIYFLPLTEDQVAEKLRTKQPSSKAPVTV